MLPFGKNSTPPIKPNRNTFDLSHQNNLTMDYGGLYPCLCLPVLPGDSFKTSVAFGIRALPTAFPVQTRVRADVHFFYVRNRNLWKDWPNFIGQTGDTSKYSLPYIDRECKYDNFKTGSLGDYLGLPTTIAGSRSVEESYTDARIDFVQHPALSGQYYGYDSQFISLKELIGKTDNPIPFNRLVNEYLHEDSKYQFFVFSGKDVTINAYSNSEVRLLVSLTNSGFTAPNLSGYTPYLVPCNMVRKVYSPPPYESYNGKVTYTFEPVDNFTKLKRCFVSANQINQLVTLGSENQLKFDSLCLIYLPDEADTNVPSDLFKIADYNNVRSSLARFSKATYTYNGVVEVNQNDIDYLPEINALPFRAYESIYNAFYRDQRNNPYIVNGVADPNVYLPTTEGGPDRNDYSLRFRNWEQDYLTTALPSPQQGNAPLVGITSSGVATFADDDGTAHTVKLTTADDGDTITGAEFSNNLPNSVSRAIVNLATSGISISDFRGVNAYQRWLEINMRRGLKYKDQILSHFGVDPSYAELDMPEFLGGATQFFDPSQVNQMSESEGSPLGSYAGQMSAVGANKHDITHYFDEHGYVIGIISIVPVPVYDQNLDKDWIKRSPLDFYFPEFGHLSFQPISYNEVAPFQAIKSHIPLNSTYGYQRPWYEYLQRTDTAHGDFRTTLRDFIIGRTFDTAPSLNASFLTVNPNQINNVFTVGTVKDSNGNEVRIQPFLGQLHFDLTMRRPIPLYGIPRLE